MHDLRSDPEKRCLTYQYDGAGNRVSLTRGNGTASLPPNAVASASYDAANEQTAFAGATLTYDANGNLTNDGVNTYQWDARNRLIGISGNVTASFTYDALGRRLSKVVNGTNVQFAYDGIDIIAEISGGLVGANYLRSFDIDEPFIQQSATDNQFFHADALGRALALSTAQGAPATTYGYEPFGKTTVTGTNANAFQYTGRENDGENLYQYRSRYYSTTYHRFIQEDRLGFLGSGVNAYAYVINSLLRWIDPGGWAYQGPALDHSSVTITQNGFGNRTLGFSIQGGQGGSNLEVRIGVGQAPNRGRGGLGQFKPDTYSQISLQIPLNPNGTGSGSANISGLTGGGESYLQIKIVHPGAPTGHLTNFPQDDRGGRYPIGLCGKGLPPCDVLKGYEGPDASGYVEPGTASNSKTQQ